MHIISNKIVRWFLQGLQAKDIDLSLIYKRHNIDQTRLSEAGGILTSEQFAALMRAVFELTNDESVGYTDNPLRLGSFRMMCHATINCANLRQALFRMMLYFNLLSDELQWSLVEQGEEAKLIFCHSTKTPPINGFFVAFMMTFIWRWSAWMVDYPLLLNRVSFSFPDQNYQQELNSIFKTSVFCQQPTNQLVLPAQYLNLPIKRDSQSLNAFLQNSPECLLSNYQADNSLASQLRSFLQQLDSLETVTLTSMAEHFNCTAQTLARRLKDEGVQFQELKDKIRKSRAVYLLLKSSLSISEISSQLGYSEDSVFYRSFKKWTGLTPKQFRQE